MFVKWAESSEWMFSSELWGWVERSTTKPQKNVLRCLHTICSQVQNSAELVQESWLALAILAKALQRHYVNTLAPAGGENAACGCAAKSCCASAARCYFLSQTFISHLLETADCFPPGGWSLADYLQSLLGDCPQCSFCRAMNVPPAVHLHSLCCCRRCEVIQGCLT